MIDKQDFYHGVVVLRLLDDERVIKVRKQELGYLVNDEIFVFIKYSTKSGTPWRFTITDSDISRLQTLASGHKRLYLAFVCGGDGICPVSWKDAELLIGNTLSWISVTRKFNESYGVAGTNGQLSRKVPVQQWPSILFEETIGVGVRRDDVA